jgi:5-methylcytosine-specific restriction enzyme A
MAAKKNPHLMKPREWYRTHAWRRIASMQLKLEPLCRACRAVGRVERAWACDHVNGFNNFNEFLCGPFQSLCRGCSDTKQRGHAPRPWIGLDGMPIAASVPGAQAAIDAARDKLARSVRSSAPVEQGGFKQR